MADYTHLTERLSQSSATAEMVYPTIGAWAAGRAIGLLMTCIPIPVGRHRLSMFLFGLPIAPVAAALYLLQKAVGVRYHLTGEAIEELPGIGTDARTRVTLDDVAAAEVMVRPGQSFHRAGDLVLTDAVGAELMTLNGIPRPERIRSAVLDIRDSRRKLREVSALLAVRPSVDELKAQAAKEKAAAAAAKKLAAEKAAEAESQA